MNYRQTAGVLLAGTGFWAMAAGVPRDSNSGNTANYQDTKVEAQLMVGVREDSDVVHFIRDNNDPRVITRTYVLQHADPYEIRTYLREMVQAKRVGNTAPQQTISGAPANPSPASKTVLGSVTAQPGYTPETELGSNTAVECMKFNDGTGILIISAEDYRFDDQENGMGIDSLVTMLDSPGIVASSGQPKFLYFPGNVPARNLLPLIQNVGMNAGDVTELWQGKDRVAYDPELNCLFFNVANYSRKNIETMLAKYDLPIPEVRMKLRLYEIYAENDDKIGVDFQAWKNNQGVDFFSLGGRYRDNWAATYGGTMGPTGSERTSYYNFNPKWNSRYLDFLASRSHAKVAYTGELTLRNNTPATLDRRTRVFYMDSSKKAPGTTDDPGIGPAKLLSLLIPDPDAAGADIPIGKDNSLEVMPADESFGFILEVINASVTEKATTLEVKMRNSSLIGYQSNGKPRVTQDSSVEQTVMLGNGVQSFVLGGITKQELVRSSGGVPGLKSIPWLGYLFETESTSIKHSQLVLVADCELVYPESMIPVRDAERIDELKKIVKK